jgi:hypothetical protein
MLQCCSPARNELRYMIVGCAFANQAPLPDEPDQAHPSSQRRTNHDGTCPFSSDSVVDTMQSEV